MKGVCEPLTLEWRPAIFMRPWAHPAQHPNPTAHQRLLGGDSDWTQLCTSERFPLQNQSLPAAAFCNQVVGQLWKGQMHQVTGDFGPMSCTRTNLYIQVRCGSQSSWWLRCKQSRWNTKSPVTRLSHLPVYQLKRIGWVVDRLRFSWDPTGYQSWDPMGYQSTPILCTVSRKLK